MWFWLLMGIGSIIALCFLGLVLYTCVSLAVVFATIYPITTAVIVALLSLTVAIYLYISYPLWLSDEKQEELAKAWTYPAKRKRLRKAALKGSLTALEKLPYPEEQETLQKVALNGSGSHDARLTALKKIGWPDTYHYSCSQYGHIWTISDTQTEFIEATYNSYGLPPTEDTYITHDTYTCEICGETKIETTTYS